MKEVLWHFNIREEKTERARARVRVNIEQEMLIFDLRNNYLLYKSYIVDFNLRRSAI